jgi:hypothetical protein
MAVFPTSWRPGLAGMLLVLLSAAGLAQDEAGQSSDDETAAPTESEAAARDESPADDAEAELAEDPELDVQGFDPTADDDFVPSEDIPADAPIAFPTDI